MSYWLMCYKNVRKLIMCMVMVVALPLSAMDDIEGAMAALSIKQCVQIPSRDVLKQRLSKAIKINGFYYFLPEAYIEHSGILQIAGCFIAREQLKKYVQHSMSCYVALYPGNTLFFVEKIGDAIERVMAE